MGDIAVKYDVAIIGSGPGGYVAALRAAQLGKSVILIEDTELGGVCLNVGCIPSKALIHASSFFRNIEESQLFGISAQAVSLDTEKMQSWKKDVVKKLVEGIAFLCKNYGVEILKGKAFFKDSRTLGIPNDKNVATVEFDYCIIATGSKPVELPFMKFDERQILSSTGALALRDAPESLAVVGGGYIGLELGIVYAKLGCKVTIIELGDQLLPGTDPELIVPLQKQLEKYGVKILLQSAVEGCEKKDNSVILSVNPKNKGEKFSIEVEKVLVAVGRKPYSEGLQLDTTKVQLDEKGFMIINEQCRTTDNRIFAIGDITGNPMLAHKASRQAKIAAEVIAGHNVAFDNHVVPAVVFTDPEIAYVGLQEHEAKAQGYTVVIGKFPFKALGRALTMNKTEGFVKIVADQESQIVLGIQIVGEHASDLISECALAIEMAAQLEDLASVIHPHPTMPEAIMEAAEDALGKCVHQGKKKH